jgi:hypothetical protein
MNAVLPPDDTAHQDAVLMVEVTSLNTVLGRYVLRFLEADAGGPAELPLADEQALAERVAAVAVAMHGRAARRQQQGDRRPLVGCSDEERS